MRIREIRWGDRDVPVALVYYYGMGITGYGCTILNVDSPTVNSQPGVA
jgi:hypothetical protein